MISIRRFMTAFSLLLGLLVVQDLSAASVDEGKQSYQHFCQFCHGEKGVSSMPGAPSFKRGDVLFKSDFEIKKHIERGKNACPPHIGILKRQQIFDVIAYLRTFYP